MGCAQSKIENEEAVARCKERKQLMKDAVSSRNAFAAAHSAYTVALKNTGAALSDYGQGEAPDPRPSASAPSSSTAAAVHPPTENLPPPPPPPPPPLPVSDFPPAPLQRAASMPDLPVPKSTKKPPAGAAIREEEDGYEDLNDGLDASASASGRPAGSSSPPPPLPPHSLTQPTPPPPPMPEAKGMEAAIDYLFGTSENMPGPSLDQPEEPHPQMNEVGEDKLKRAAASKAIGGDDPPATLEKVVAQPQPPKQAKKLKQASSAHHQHAASSGGATDSKRGKMVLAAARSVSLLQVLNELDEHFLEAYECAHDVSKMLEATRMHYHSNFADNRGHIDHSARVLQVITWNRSLKGIPNADDGKDDFDSDEWETHATVLDKMLAWEKKLYDEVKTGELMKIEYQKKIALLNKQKKRGVNPEVLIKTKSAVSHLHTRYIVDMQSMDSTVSEINHLRDDRLYPKLVELADGMAKMWETMYIHHDSQLKIVADLRVLDISLAPKETSEKHHEWTIQLWEVLREWHSQFQKLMIHQKAYIRALNGWLKLNLIPIESSLKEKVSSPTRVLTPPIQALLHEWHDMLEKLPDELARVAIHSFSEVIHTIVLHQEDELKLKEKCEETRREHTRKARSFEDWYHKYSQRKAASSSAEEADPVSSEGANHQDAVVERRFAVETLKLRLESEVEAHQRLCKQVREKSLASLKTHLPELFRAMSDFARACSEMYKKLKPIGQLQDPEDG